MAIQANGGAIGKRRLFDPEDPGALRVKLSRLGEFFNGVGGLKARVDLDEGGRPVTTRRVLLRKKSANVLRGDFGEAAGKGRVIFDELVAKFEDVHGRSARYRLMRRGVREKTEACGNTARPWIHP